MSWNQEEEEEHQLSLSRFEAMLKTNKIFFFDSEEFENIILHYLDTGKTNLAKKALKLGLEQHPKSTGLKLVQAEILITESKYDLAERLLHELYIIEPTNEEIYIQKATICSKRGDHDKAIELLKVALKYTDDPADVYSLIGMEYLFTDQIEQAKDNFINCLKHDTEDYSSLYNVVYCFDLLEQHQEAIPFLIDFIDRNPFSEVAWHQLGRQYYALKNYEEAVKAFDYAVVIDDSFVGAYIEKGKSLERLRKIEDALSCYNLALEHDNTSWYIFYRIGKCYEKLRSNELALQYYDKAITEDPIIEKAWLSKIDLLIKLENYDEAHFQTTKALDLDAENDAYWKRYGSINFILEHYDRAHYGFEKAIELHSDDLNVYLMLADLEMAFFSNYSQAIAILNKASKLFEEHFEIEYRLSGLHYLSENTKKAAFHLERALTVAPKKLSLFRKLFPNVFDADFALKIIRNYQKPQS